MDDVDGISNKANANTKNVDVKKRKKKGKNKGQDQASAMNGEGTTEVQRNGTDALPPLPASISPNALSLAAEQMRRLQLQKDSPQFQFWKTQPVPALDEVIEEGCNEAIEADKPLSDIKQEPYNLPPGFQWETLDLNCPDVLQNLYVLLYENYVEDDDNMFRFDYSKEFLQWALLPPGFKKNWHVGVTVAKTGKLMGFISAVPATVNLYDKTKEMVEINFLCVHKKLRSKRLAPVLIKEITRRVNLTGIFQAVYTAGVELPQPVSSCRYWHRNLNPKKLLEVKFSHLGKNMTMQRTLKLYKLPENVLTKGFRTVVKEDLPRCRELLQNYLRNFNLSPLFSSEQEFQHWFLPRKDVVNSYLVEDEDGKITDFVSFYTLPSTVMHHPVHNSIKAAYSFYNVSTATPWTQLMKDALIMAANNGYDVFNCLDLMDNQTFLEELKFGKGDGNLQYYLYNWRCTGMPSNKVGLVLQ